MVSKNDCELFDTGRFNDIALAYLILTLRRAGTAPDHAVRFLDIYGQVLDEVTAEEAINALT